MGDFNAQVGKIANPTETATGQFGHGLRIERGDTLVEWVTLRKYETMKAEIDYILTNRPDTVTYVTVVNHVNIGSDHGLAMSNIKLEVQVKRKRLMTKTPPKVDVIRIE